MKTLQITKSKVIRVNDEVYERLVVVALAMGVTTPSTALEELLNLGPKHRAQLLKELFA